MRKSLVAVLVTASALVAVAACSKGESPASESTQASGNTSAPQAAADNTEPVAAVGDKQAKEIFKTRCATCHGNEGRGDGPGSIALNPKPRNYHDKVWQAKVTDEDIAKVITYGGAAVGKSPIMPANPDLDSKPEVVAALVHIVRGFGK